jgi:hypothetical protein
MGPFQSHYCLSWNTGKDPLVLGVLDLTDSNLGQVTAKVTDFGFCGLAEVLNP